MRGSAVDTTVWSSAASRRASSAPKNAAIRRRCVTRPARSDAVRLRQVADARGVVRVAWTHPARELVVAVRLGVAALLLEAPAERVVRVVVRRRQLEDRTELRLGCVPVADAEVGDAERLADRGLVRLAELRLLERHGRLRGHPLREPLLAFAEELVRVAHMPLRYGKFSSIKSTGRVKSRVRPISTPRIVMPSSTAR